MFRNLVVVAVVAAVAFAAVAQTPAAREITDYERGIVDAYDETWETTYRAMRRTPADVKVAAKLNNWFWIGQGYERYKYDYEKQRWREKPIHYWTDTYVWNMDGKSYMHQARLPGKPDLVINPGGYYGYRRQGASDAAGWAWLMNYLANTRQKPRAAFAHLVMARRSKEIDGALYTTLLNAHFSEPLVSPSATD